MGRHTVDEATAAIATERLARLLAAIGPRRAMGGDPRDADTDRDLEDTRPGGMPVERRTEEAGTVDPLLGRVGSFGRRHLGVLALVLLVGLGAAGWAVLRARPVAEATPLTVATTSDPGRQPASGGPEQSSGRPSPATTPGVEPVATPGAATIVVHVVGAVRKPGVVNLSERSRVKDAIEAAGGLRSDARPVELNLAQVVRDGQQIVIGTARHPRGEVRDGTTVPGGSANGSVGGAGGGSGPGPRASAGVTVELNTATVTQLDTLPGVGPVTAERILAWRTAHGRFSRVEELQEVDGIGPKTYAQIAPHVRV